jgi:hypothetical protein
VDIYFPARETRAKPDLVAFDGVTTAVPGFNPFYGTSAAAPDTAAVAALMLAKNSCRTPAQIQRALVASAVDIGASGTDPVAGAGDLDALAALEAVPPPTCSADAQCDDGDPCTADLCDGCSCEHRNPCDDGNPCTVDACDPVTACSATPVEGFAGVACVCGQDVGAGACSGTALPSAVRKRFEHACRLVARAAAITSPARERRLVGRALGAFARARQRVSTGVRRGTVASACAQAVGAVIDDARVRAARLRSTL